MKTYLIYRGFVGNNLLFWAKGDSGYTCHLDNAKEFTRDEALKLIHNNPEKGFLQISIEQARSAATLQVDTQRIK